MSLLLVATLLAATPEADDVVVQADGTVLHGQVISCGDGIRFLPNGFGEIHFSPESVLAVTRTSGEACVIRRPRSVAGGVAALVLFPVLGSFLGGAVGVQACPGDGWCAIAFASAGPIAVIIVVVPDLAL